MSEIRSTDPHGQLIVAHDTRATVWDDETTADIAEAIPGRVVPAGDTLMRLVASAIKRAKTPSRSRRCGLVRPVRASR